jgi:hypothetical protein
MDEINVMLKNVLTEQLSDQLRTRMDIMIQEVVGREIKQRVEHQVCSLLSMNQPKSMFLFTLQLKVQIPQSLREQVMQHKRQILQVQTNLHNSSVFPASPTAS